MTIKDLLNQGRETLRKAKIENPGFEAELLLTQVLNCDRVYFYTHSQNNVSNEEEIRYIDIIKRRCNHEPMAYIFEKKEFMGMDFSVNANVLIPRPDTEPMIEYLIDLLNKNYHEGAKVFDLCTGSGAIGISLKRYFPLGDITLGDVSKKALEVAKKNGEALVNGKVRLLEGDLFQSIPKGEKFDLIVSNPPYIRKAEMKDLSLDILNYEPRLALDGGESGLDFYEKITCEGKNYLNSQGLLALEIGDGQELQVKELMLSNGYTKIIEIKDLTGNVRSLIGRLNRD